MKDILDRLEERRASARRGGGEKRIDTQHKRGKLTARERMELLMDRDSFEEFDMFVEHRATDFDMDKTKISGDGVVTGPDVVKTVTNEVVTAEELGGATVHTVKSSVADGAYENDVECLLQMRRLIDFLPSSAAAGPPEWPSFDDIEREDPSLDTLVPDNPNKPYDMKE
ncbi:MAG TPA: carboxyl transferase domain-containing protein, partial [Xanthobacteraceae bacterium]